MNTVSYTITVKSTIAECRKEIKNIMIQITMLDEERYPFDSILTDERIFALEKYMHRIKKQLYAESPNDIQLKEEIHRYETLM